MTARACTTLFLLIALSGCAGPPAAQVSQSPCDLSEASYACQVKRYHDVAQ